MDPAELRIGNRIDYTSNQKFNGIFDEEFARYMFDVRDEWQFLKPIKITEEWLLKLGLERKSRGLEFVWVTKHYMFLNLDFGWYFRFKFDGFITFNFGDFFVKDLQYVHQFQNLYFALTGEDL